MKHFFIGMAPILLLVTCSCVVPIRYTYHQSLSPAVNHSAQTGKSVVRIVSFTDATTGPRYRLKYFAEVDDPINALGREITNVLAAKDTTRIFVYDQDTAVAGETGTTYLVKGTITKLYWSAYPELWSLIPPVIIVWPLHFIGLPIAPSHNIMRMQVQIEIVDPVTNAVLQSGKSICADFEETIIYSIFNIIPQDTKFQNHSMDAAIMKCVEIIQKSIEELSGQKR